MKDVVNPGLPILCLDFDGVIHDYRRGWQGGEIYGDVTPGFWEWLDKAHRYFRIVVYSSRSKDAVNAEAMEKWLAGRTPKGFRYIPVEFAHEKPPAFLTIDDRALTFEGSWDRFDPVKLREFKPWMMK